MQPSGADLWECDGRAPLRSTLKVDSDMAFSQARRTARPTSPEVERV